MNFSTPDRVGSVINVMKQAEIQRAPNRATLNGFYNGDAPWTDQECKEHGILINYNEKTGTDILHKARNQYESAFTKTGNFFTVTVPDAPEDKQKDYGTTITRHINRTMRNNRGYYYTMDNVWGGVVLHGVGARVWWDKDDWKPGFVGIQDILMPTDTDLQMDDNLRYFAVRRSMRPGKLMKKTLLAGKNVDPGWNLKQVKKILDTFKELNTNAHNYDWSNQPEQMMELVKQNQCFYDSDSAPMIYFWDFYHREEEFENPNLNGWYRDIILDDDCKPVTGQNLDSAATNFVYHSKKPLASKLDQIIHFQFGDGNNVPPFKYHSIRSLAWILYDLCWIMNRINCQFTQHVMEQMMLLFRVQDPSDRDRLQQLILQGIVGILPDGLNMVTATERYQVNVGLVESLTSGLKQRISENSSQYTQAADTGTQKERTKYETQAVLAQASALMATMIGRAYRQEHFACLEIARRFCIKNSQDFDVKKFRQKCIEDGVPEKYLDSDRWDIEVEQVLGGGNRTIEIAEATELVNRLQLFDPNAQQEIKHDYVLAVTNNSKKAGRLAPLDAMPKVTDAIHDAQLAFGTLMLGVQMDPKEGINHPEQIETLLKLMAQVIARINQSGGVGTPQDVAGLQSVAAYIGKHIAIFAQDKENKPKVKEYTDALSKMMNLVRAFAQRQAEEQQKQGGQSDPTTMVKIQGQIAELQTKLKINEAKAAQQLRQKDAKHRQQLAHSDEKLRNELKNKTGVALAETALNGMRDGATPPKTTSEKE
jgi:hypothetical protein